MAGESRAERGSGAERAPPAVGRAGFTILVIRSFENYLSYKSQQRVLLVRSGPEHLQCRGAQRPFSGAWLQPRPRGFSECTARGPLEMLILGPSPAQPGPARQSQDLQGRGPWPILSSELGAAPGGLPRSRCLILGHRLSSVIVK